MSTYALEHHRRALAAAAVGVALLAGAGCTDLPMPPELANSQILGVRAANPAIPAGQRTALDLLLGGPAGVLEPDSVEWAVVGLNDSVPAIGSIETEGDQVFYVAPAEVSGIELATVEVTVTAGDRTLEAVKGIAVGAPAATDNPSITGVQVDGVAVEPGARLQMAIEEAATLEMAVNPAAGDGADYAWYSNVAEIDLYRRTPSELVTGEEPGEGVVIAVYRDGLGGIDWTTFELVVGE